MNQKKVCQVCQETTTGFDFNRKPEENGTMNRPDSFQEAVIGLMMEKGHNLRQAFNEARKIYPALYLADRYITESFSENAWFGLIRESKSMAASQNIPLREAFKRIYEIYPQLAKEFLGRDFV